MESEDFPSITSGKRARTPSPDKETPGKTPRTTQDQHSSTDHLVKASFMLRATTGAKVFANPSRVSRALHQSPLGKYIIEGETRSLGNGSALIVAVWEHNIPKIPDLEEPTFTLGEWEITCRRADRDCDDYKYARVGPLADDADIEEIRDGFKSFGTEEVVEITWIPPHCLPRSTTGKWIRLKVRGPIPTKVAINQIVYWARPFLLPMLRCPGCLKIGHSINTCRSPRRCSRCSGPHTFLLDENTCTRPYYCFQCGGSHGPRSIHCPHNQDAQQLYSTLARDGVTLPEINKQLRELQLPKTKAPRRPPPPPPKPATSTSSPARTVQPGISFASITTENRYNTLMTLQEEENSIQDAPIAPTSPPARKLNHPRKPPRRQSGYLPPPTTPTPPDLDNEIHQFVTTAEVHQQQDNTARQGRETHRTSRHTTSLPPQHLQNTPYPPENTPSSPPIENFLSSLFSLLWKGYHLYQKGTSVPNILTALWPTLSILMSTLFS